MTDVSEVEVEAARAALRDQLDIWVAPISMRAALTAAAQVRERADRETDDLPSAEKLEQHMAMLRERNEQQLSHDKFCRELAEKLVPPTEDQGEDVLGMRKGEENT